MRFYRRHDPTRLPGQRIAPRPHRAGSGRVGGASPRPAGDDCYAAEIVTNALARLGGVEGSEHGLDAIDVGSLEIPFQRTFGKLQSALPEFEKINAAAARRSPTRSSSAAMPVQTNARNASRVTNAG
jgi:hypothetical protein